MARAIKLLGMEITPAQFSLIEHCLDSTSKRNTLSASRVYACQRATFTSAQKNAQFSRLKRDEARA
ncbi:hypothetical protein, partial [Xanthomonas cissicola]|uniref:hypothetical protein n=1 Tax=Xanthomonas cissicola TaxID=86186 RepID=UPI0012477DA7